MKTQRALSAFLGKHGFDAGGLNLGALTDSILYDMETGLGSSRSPSSLDMIPTWTAPGAERIRNTRVIAIDAGGTNLRSALVDFDGGGRATVSSVQKTGMPGRDRIYSRGEFFDALAAGLDRLKDASPRIGFCFSYAMAITPDEDGRVIQFSKEILAPEVVGAPVGACLAEALHRRGWGPVEKITLINDTKAALLSGAAAAPGGAEYSSYVGFILGTGLNAAYIEKEPIPKVLEIEGPGVIPPRQVVVCESGKFSRAPQSDFDRVLDAGTATPGSYLLEKMCSGAYLGTLASVALRAASAEGLFSPALGRALSDPSFTLKDVDQFLWFPRDKQGPLGRAAALGTEEDYAALYLLLDSLVDRAARIAASVIAAAVIKSGEGKNPSRPVCVTPEGTVVHRTHRLKERLLAYLWELLRERGRSFDMLTPEDSITLGAAIAACSGPSGGFRGRC
ncbi:MAG: hexokinase [Spirochaetaceae bacterium]|jgi:hexokinase|nr:hexokinase [Spirochaetaceae bacterium]